MSLSDIEALLHFPLFLPVGFTIVDCLYSVPVILVPVPSPTFVAIRRGLASYLIIGLDLYKCCAGKRKKIS